MSRVEHLAEGVTLYLGDCREILPTLGKVDAVVTDPPYGIGEAAGRSKSRTSGFRPKARVASRYKRDYGFDSWDNATADEGVASAVSIARWAIIFGGNYYNLPPTSCWLVWDKLNGETDFADCELAWTNLPKAVRLIRFMWNGCMRRERDIERVHPTQKPVGVMTWCLGHLPDDVKTVCDPFMGSGTTGVACVSLGLGFIGIERNQKYFDIACKRISAALTQPDIFTERLPPVVQGRLL